MTAFYGRMQMDLESGRPVFKTRMCDHAHFAETWVAHLLKPTP